MEELNVCRFIPIKKASEQTHIINFVYETGYKSITENKIDTCYKMIYVVEGSCTVNCRGRRELVKKGDVFLCFHQFLIICLAMKNLSLFMSVL